jgi:hypothetical protein
MIKYVLNIMSTSITLKLHSAKSFNWIKMIK